MSQLAIYVLDVKQEELDGGATTQPVTWMREVCREISLMKGRITEDDQLQLRRRSTISLLSHLHVQIIPAMTKLLV